METEKLSAEMEDIELTLTHLKSEDDKVHKDFMSLRDTFVREIDQKDKKRRSLMESIQKLEMSQIENSKKDRILNKNIQIYKKNIKEIEKRLAKLNKRENWIKKNYSNIVYGTMSGPKQLSDMSKPGSLSDIFYNLFKDNMKLRGRPLNSKLEELQHQKEEFLGTLQDLFKKYDDELISINNEKIKSNDLKKGIETKHKNAVNKKKELKANNKTTAEQISKSEKDLETTLNEEKILIAEFQKIVQSIKADLNVSDLTMEVLIPPENLNENR